MKRGDLPEAPEALPGPVVDTHCHLDVAEQVSGLDPDVALERAAAVGITRLVQVGCDVEGSHWAVAAAARWPQVVAAVAIHPNDAARMSPTELAAGLAEIDRLAADSGVRAVGETGMDFYRTTEAEGHRVQREAFAAHLAMAKAHGLTLVIHDRDAHAAILDVLAAEGWPERTVMHCFSGDADVARACLDGGAHLSFAGTVTFKNNEHLRDALRLAPQDRILVETDAPFLTPMPYRGRANASYLVPLTVRLMADVRSEDEVEVCRALDRNAEVAFGGSWG